MRWSKVRKLVEDSFADSVKGRVTVHSTTYRDSPLDRHYVRAWIAIDKRHVANYDDTIVATLGKESVYSHEPESHDVDPTREKLHGGGFLGQEFTHCCFVYAHARVNESLRDPSSIIRALAMLNAKVGRQRLAKYAAAETHPLPKALAEFRMAVEAEARPPKPLTD